MKTKNGLKKCSKCGEMKGVEEYGKLSASPDGYRTICKFCMNKYNATYRKENKESIRLSRNKYYSNNKDKYKEYRDRYKPYRILYMDNYRITHAAEIREYKKIYDKRDVEKKRRRLSQWSINNRDKIAGYRSKNSETLSDSFIIQRITDKLNLNASQIRENPELIEIKRTILKTKRLCKTLRNSEAN